MTDDITFNEDKPWFGDHRIRGLETNKVVFTENTQEQPCQVKEDHFQRE
jgi:hypothetical protein